MEAPPLKHFLMVISLLGIFVSLVCTMPSELYASSPSYRERQIPSYFESLDLDQFSNTYVINLTDSPEYYTKKWGKTETGHHMYFKSWAWSGQKWHLKNEHYYDFLGFVTGNHAQEWINNNGFSREKTLYEDEIDADFENTTASYTVQCSHFRMNAWIGYNSSLYSCIRDAWADESASVLFAIEWDQRGSGLNAWSLLGGILFFQLPEIHWTLNLLIAIPLWACFAWLAFAFILAVIKSLPLT